jgi:hypothetical protein
MDLTMTDCENDVCNEITHKEIGILACNAVQIEESPAWSSTFRPLLPVSCLACFSIVRM